MIARAAAVVRVAHALVIVHVPRRVPVGHTRSIARAVGQACADVGACCNECDDVVHREMDDDSEISAEINERWPRGSRRCCCGRGAC